MTVAFAARLRNFPSCARLEPRGLRAMPHCFSLLLALALTAGGILPGRAAAQDAADLATDNVAPSMTARMLEELSAAYAQLAAMIGDNPAEAVGWAQEDVENLGDWEYRIVEIDERDDTALEAELNALGNERWEVYWVADSNDGLRFFLKRPALSYLSRVPLAALMRMLGGAGQ
jgi:hypothetical protein